MKNFIYSFEQIEELDGIVDGELYSSSSVLIQLFCANNDLKTIRKYQSYITKTFPHATLIGTTTDGIIENEEVYVATKSVASFSLFDSVKLKSALVKHLDNYENSFESGVALAKRVGEENTKVIISFADGINTNGEEFARGVNSVLQNIPLAGGLAADNGKVIETFVFDNEEISSSGAVGVSLASETLHVSKSYTFDWTAIGKKMVVTKSVKNRVYEIDGIAAVEVYAKYMGHEFVSKLPQIGVEFPLICEKANLSIGRAVVLKHDDGSLTFAGNIEEGESVRFGVGDIETILLHSDYNAKKLMNDIKYQAEGVFIYSCMARRRFLGERIRDELRPLQSLGNVSGFFTYGEFFNANESNHLLNETMTVLALTESSSLVANREIVSIKEPQNDAVNSKHILAHLANVVSKELEELNSFLEKTIEENSAYSYQQAYYDKLTQLPNRLSLINKLSESIGKMLILINIDDFTTINDFYGHEIGDNVLKKLAKVLRDLTKDEEAEVFKLPSDEFAIILEVPSAKSGIEERIKRCIASIEHEDFIVKDGHSAHVSVTLSAAMINKDKTGLVNADMALKLAKRAGLDYMIFSEDLKLSKQYAQNIQIANRIKDAIHQDRIIPYFQPIFSTNTKEIEKYEALVRLRLPNGDILSPFAFLEVSQKIKLYPQITKIMIEKTFQHFKKEQHNFSINLSFSDILNEETRAYLFEKIEEYGIASQLTIEILETMENDNSERVDAFTEAVYQAGAKIAIDDFGSGFANFEHMTKIRSDFMKIDGSLIKNIDKDKNARLVVETIIVFARKLNKKVVAEFVHSKEVFDVVKELGIEYIQGYYLAEPSPTTR